MVALIFATCANQDTQSKVYSGGDLIGWKDCVQQLLQLQLTANKVIVAEKESCCKTGSCMKNALCLLLKDVKLYST